MNLHQIKELLKKSFVKHLIPAISSLDLLPVGGGSINDTYKVIINGSKKYFLKLNSLVAFPGLFEKEKNGLEFLARQNYIRIPSVIFYETNDNYQLLLLEWIEGSIRNESFWKKFGAQLAQLHTINNETFGFMEDNYMGSLTQENTFANNWVDFFIQYRLQPQINLARNQDRLDKNHVASFESLFKKLDSVFNTENPSLIHGDLWSGNFMCTDQSLPVLIDPAVYFGHRNMDLAMTTLFGGFDKAFYDSYHYYYPLSPNYRKQWEVCNLYPLLIHLNLFGKSYLSGITNTLKKFS
jgi:protein-ribulosamine 3-kinase